MPAAPFADAPLVRFIEPMACQRVTKLPEGDGWIHEKQDGNRVIAVVDGKMVLLHLISGLDTHRNFHTLHLL
jgi:ATP-dependent DNA ligase